MIITIDGPVASGKSTVACALAKRLGMYYLYTGLLYRAFAYVLLHHFHKVMVEKTVGEVCEQELALVQDLSYDYHDNKPYVLFQGEDITDKLYETHLDEASSMVSAVACVRKALLPIQHTIAKKYDIIADGRDCGTYVFPHADVKFFLTADRDVRAQRLHQDEKRHALKTDIRIVEKNIEQRDRRDQTRKVAPLIVPEDAIIIDNTLMTEEETLQRIIDAIEAAKKS